MELDRKRLLLGYLLTVMGLLLAYVVAEVIPTPAPPACSTAACTAAQLSSLVGLFVIILGMLILAFALFRGRGAVATQAQEFPSSEYTFLPTSPASGAQPSLPSAGPPVTQPAEESCPACGAPVTSNYGFCPRCGRTLSK